MAEWREIPEFPGYVVSDEGRVAKENGHEITQSYNQRRIPHVALMRDGKQWRREVALLVAQTFLPEPPAHMQHFNTPINLDGDRTNNHVDNLMWRPRWFAIKYHQQLMQPTPYDVKGGVELIETGQRYRSVRECATKLGLLEKEIIMGALNNNPVFPSWFRFRFTEK